MPAIAIDVALFTIAPVHLILNPLKKSIIKDLIANLLAQSLCLFLLKKIIAS
nr:MAG TPA: hypothetical protein [Caudoviricetes sp.]